jgi:transcription elongation factor S-II
MDEFKVGQTGDATRNKIQSALCDAIGSDDGSYISAAEVAVRIEQHMYGIFKDTGANYKQKFRDLVFNLRDPKNPELNQALLKCQFEPEALVVASNAELASEESSKKRKADLDWMMAASRGDQQLTGITQSAGETDMFTCGGCKNNRCSYYQKQTRSADEPMTVFVTCLVCKLRWKMY